MQFNSAGKHITMHSFAIYDTRAAGFTYQNPFAADGGALELAVVALTVASYEGITLPRGELRLLCEGDYPVKVVDGRFSSSITLAGVFRGGVEGILMQPAYEIRTHPIDNTAALNKLAWSLVDDTGKSVPHSYMIVHVASYEVEDDEASDDSAKLDDFLEGETFRKMKPFAGEPVKLKLDEGNYWSGASCPIKHKVSQDVLDELDDHVRYTSMTWDLRDLEADKFGKLMKKWREHACMTRAESITVLCKANLNELLAGLKWPGDPTWSITN